MKLFRWNLEKDEYLKETRGIGFDEVVFWIESGGVLSIEKNSSKKYPAQEIMIVEIRNYAFVVPFVETEDEVFLKTIFPSRKATKKILAMNLDKEEKELLRSYEAGEWEPVDDVKAAKSKMQAIAKTTLKKNKRINIRLTEMDLRNLKARAVEEGIPYQTLVSSILHKFLSGRLKEVG